MKSKPILVGGQAYGKSKQTTTSGKGQAWSSKVMWGWEWSIITERMGLQKVGIRFWHTARFGCSTLFASFSILI